MKTTILLIDEAQLERKINEWTLTHAGYEVVSASNAEEALRLAEQKAPDVIVLDGLLPDIQGRAFLTELKRHSALAAVPVIVLAANPAVNVRRFKQEGAAEIVEKEKTLTDSGVLLHTVELVLHPVL